MALVFKVRRSEPELVKPAKATPNEVKSLSDWDDRMVLRDWMSGILFYDPVTASRVKDPAETIKRALAETLVYYYPMAGRFKEQGPEKRLVVDCTSEGVSFVCADADVRLDQFGLICPPFPCMEELLSNKPADSTTTLSYPIFVLQVTRLACGGFILAFAINHVMSDVVGGFQFLGAVSELACGAPSPRVMPVWRREILNARATCFPSSNTIPQSKDHDHDVPHKGRDTMTYRSFFFGPQEVEAIRARLPHFPGDRFSSFDLISACVFHCRVVSVEHAPEQKMCAVITVSARSKFTDPPLPLGYYGNSSVSAIIVCPMKNFHDLQYVVEEVKKAKDGVTEDYLRSLIDEQAMQRLSSVPRFALNCPTYIISDLSRVGLSYLDFGGGRPVYAGATNEINIARPVIYMIASTNSKGEHGRLVTLYMSEDAMDKFDRTLQTLLGAL